MGEFPEDNTCHALDTFGLCLAAPTVTLLVEGGGWVAKLCAEHFEEQQAHWSLLARRQAKRLAETASLDEPITGPHHSEAIVALEVTS